MSAQQEKPKIVLPPQFYETLALILRRVARDQLKREAAERAVQDRARQAGETA